MDVIKEILFSDRIFIVIGILIGILLILQYLQQIIMRIESPTRIKKVLIISCCLLVLLFGISIIRAIYLEAYNAIRDQNFLAEIKDDYWNVFGSAAKTEGVVSDQFEGMIFLICLLIAGCGLVVYIIHIKTVLTKIITYTTENSEAQESSPEAFIEVSIELIYLEKFDSSFLKNPEISTIVSDIWKVVKEIRKLGNYQMLDKEIPKAVIRMEQVYLPELKQQLNTYSLVALYSDQEYDTKPLEEYLSKMLTAVRRVKKKLLEPHDMDLRAGIKAITQKLHMDGHIDDELAEGKNGEK